ncbi:hypothetical protein SBRCBS47491_009125 [Sporothrix bragantina]|uniref:Major facilitator superfamily (MFS) profile domain-containing protein n=1 Tax=Sporothrix bragantina TaxID=671064 RepID=A0ABP0CS68_9PEZI
MGLGVLEPRSVTGPVPGTVVLEVEAAERIDAHNELLKRASGRHSDIVLTPQPSDDPNDPLNWPSWKKYTTMIILVMGCCFCGSITGPLLNASLAILAVELDRSFGDLTLISGYQLLVAGACGPLVSALSRKYGKRPVFLFSSVMCLVGTIIGSVSHSYSTLLAARTIQGFTLAAYESLVFTVVGDLFFVHQRGVWTMVMTFTLTCVSNLVSVVSGSITFALGWHYLFHIMNACVGFQLILLFLFVPETNYRRERSSVVPASVTADGDANEKDDGVIGVEDVRQVEAARPIPAKKTFWQELAVYNGTFTDENLFALFVAPFIVCSNLLALWTIFITGAVTAFYVAIAYVTAQLFSPPPYNLSTAAVGYISLGPFIGGALGAVLIGVLLDPLSLWLTKKNKGIYEPEFRLALTPLGLLCGIGLFGFGALSADQASVYGVAVMWGVMLCGCSFVIGPYSAYTIDAFRGMASEIFIANVMLKNFIFYAFSYFVNNWTASAGPKAPFFTFGAISLVFVSTTTLVYLFGKRYRAFWSRHNVLEKLHITTHAE